MPDIEQKNDEAQKQGSEDKITQTTRGSPTARPSEEPASGTRAVAAAAQAAQAAQAAARPRGEEEAEAQQGNGGSKRGSKATTSGVKNRRNGLPRETPWT